MKHVDNDTIKVQQISQSTASLKLKEHCHVFFIIIFVQVH